MTGLDVLVGLTFLGICVGAVVRGLLRQLMSLLVLFFATVIAGVLYPYGALALAVIGEQAPTLADGVAFLLLFAFFTVILELILKASFPDTRLPRLGVFDHVLALAPGVLCALVVSALLLTTLGHAARQPWGTLIPGVRVALARAYRHSALKPYLALFLDYYLRSLQIWFRRPPPLLSYLLR